jgi:hypothetical protein
MRFTSAMMAVTGKGVSVSPAPRKVPSQTCHGTGPMSNVLLRPGFRSGTHHEEKHRGGRQCADLQVREAGPVAENNQRSCARANAHAQVG